MEITKPIQYIADNIGTILANGGGYIDSHHKIIKPMHEELPCLCAKTVSSGQTFIVQMKREIEYTITPEGNIRGFDANSPPKAGIGEQQFQNPEGVAMTLTTAHEPKVYETKPSFRIRKLTGRECFRFMGVADSDIDKIQASGVSKTQQYKMAGNSIVVDVLAAIFTNLFVETEPQPDTQLELF